METFYWTYPNGRILINNASWVLWLWAPCQVQTFLACGMKSQWNRTEKVTEREREMAREGGKTERGNRAPSWKQARLWLILQSPGYPGGSGEASIKLEASLPRAMETPEGSERVRSVPPHSCICCHLPFSLPLWKNSDFLFWISMCEVNCPLIYTHCWDSSSV